MSRSTADLSTIREHNLTLILNLIRESGAISRAHMVRKTKLSATTVSALSSVLIQSGFVREGGRGQSRGGRRPILLEFDYAFRHVLGIGLGATQINTVLMDLSGDIVAREWQAFEVMNDPEGVTRRIQEVVTHLLAEAGLSSNQILGIGIAVPAPLEGEKLDRLSSVILPAWEGRDLVGEVQRAIGVPVYLDNDANAGAISEKWWGKGRDFVNLAYIKLGTGIGSGLIINNQIYRGDGGTAGEIGHTTIDTQGPRCRCGNRGCLESFIGAPALVAEAKLRLGHNGGLLKANGSLTVKDIIAAGLAGNPICLGVVEDAGFYLGVAIANLLNLINPGLVTLGGDLATAGDVFLRAICSSVNQRTMIKASREATIAFSELGDDAVAMGAATLAIHHAFQSSQLSQTLNTNAVPT